MRETRMICPGRTLPFKRGGIRCTAIVFEGPPTAGFRAKRVLGMTPPSIVFDEKEGSDGHYVRSPVLSFQKWTPTTVRTRAFRNSGWLRHEFTFVSNEPSAAIAAYGLACILSYTVGAGRSAFAICRSGGRTLVRARGDDEEGRRCQNQ